MTDSNDEKKINDYQSIENCKAVQFVSIDIVECLVRNSKCLFSKSFGSGWSCQHPLRKDIVKQTREGNKI